MKKTMALCVAAILTVGMSATAYAAPLQTASTCEILRQYIGGQEIDSLRQLVLQRLEMPAGLHTDSAGLSRNPF